MATRTRDFQAKVVDKIGQKGSKEGIVSLTLRIGEAGDDIRPGHFLALQPLHEKNGFFHPFSITDVWQNGGSDIRAQIWFKIRGEDTKRYAKLRIGQRLTVRAPLGKPFQIDDRVNSYTLVGGGYGFAGLMFLAKKLREMNKSVTVLLGEKYCHQTIVLERFKKFGCQVKTIVQDTPTTGYVTELLDKELNHDQGKSIVVACGPRLMLKTVHELAKRYGNVCWVNVEEMVICGNMGACKVCAVFGYDENGQETNAHICEFGTFFRAEWINWEKFIPKFTEAPIIKSIRKRNPMETRLEGQNGRFLILDTPISNGAGCLDYRGIRWVTTLETTGDIGCSHIGMFEAKGTEYIPTLGNPAPRFSVLRGGNALNSIGRESPGPDEFIRWEWPQWEKFGKPCSANLSAREPDHYGKMAAMFDKTGISALTLNLGCPNVHGEIIGKSPEKSKEVVEAARAETNKFLIIKFTPEAGDIIAVARAVKEAGADALALINTIVGMDVDVDTEQVMIAKGAAGISGPALNSRAIALTSLLYRANIGLPIIAMGGIYTWEDAAKLILAGANVIAPGTDIFNNHKIFEELYNGLWCWRKRRMANIQDLVGRARFQII